MEFKEGEKEHFVEIEILYDGHREMREAFTVHMKPDDNMVAEIQVSQRPRGAHKQIETCSGLSASCTAAHENTHPLVLK